MRSSQLASLYLQQH